MENPNQEDNAPVQDYSSDAVMQRIRNLPQQEQNPTIRIPGWVAIAVIVLIIAGLRYGYNRIGESRPPLCVVNMSSDAPLEILVNEKRIGSVPKMNVEDPKAALIKELKPGEYTLKALDNSKKVVASEKITVEKNSNGFLWTPLAAPYVRFGVQTTDYGESTGSAGVRAIQGGPLYRLPDWIATWFKDNPSGVSVPKKWKRTNMHALRRLVDAPK